MNQVNSTVNPLQNYSITQVNKAKVLAVEDSPEYQVLLKASLGARFDLTMVSTSEEALQLLKSFDYQAFVLDIRLPDDDGFHLCAKIRNMEPFRDVPIIFLTGKAAVADKVLGFSVGADDYVVKPFEPEELCVRIESKLQKTYRQALKNPPVVFGELHLELLAQRAFVLKNGVRSYFDLTPFEFKLLAYLIKSDGKVVSREKLLEALWGNEVEVMDRAVDRHISALRRKLVDTNIDIRSVYSSGYLLSQKVEECPERD